MHTNSPNTVLMGNTWRGRWNKFQFSLVSSGSRSRQIRERRESHGREEHARYLRLLYCCVRSDDDYSARHTGGGNTTASADEFSSLVSAERPASGAAGARA